MINLVTLWIVVSIVSTIIVLVTVLSAPRVEEEPVDTIDLSVEEQTGRGKKGPLRRRSRDLKRRTNGEVRSIHSVERLPQSDAAKRAPTARLSHFGIIRSEEPHS